LTLWFFVFVDRSVRCANAPCRRLPRINSPPPLVTTYAPKYFFLHPRFRSPENLIRGLLPRCRHGQASPWGFPLLRPQDRYQRSVSENRWSAIDSSSLPFCLSDKSLNRPFSVQLDFFHLFRPAWRTPRCEKEELTGSWVDPLTGGCIHSHHRGVLYAWL